MKVSFEKSFYKDLQKLKSSPAKKKLISIIEEVKSADAIRQLIRVKQLKGHPSAYRIRIGIYRLGFYIENDEVIFSRLLHRKDIYKSFP